MNIIDKKWVENNINEYGEVIIPDGIEKIESEAFKDNELVKKVVISDSVIEIGNSAFSGCTNLQDIKFSNNIKIIGEDAFLDCKSLTSIELPKSIEQIGEEAFARCEKLEKILIDKESKIKELSYALFYECKKLKEIIIPESIEKIGDGAFFECLSLENIFIPDGLKEIGSNAFSYCSKLHNIEFGENSQLKKIGDHAFYLCKELEKIKLPNRLKTLEKATFAGCYKLSSVELGNEIETIEFDVFNSCKSLKSIILPEKLSKIGACAFCDCESLKEIIGGDNVCEIQSAAFENTAIEKYIIPPKVTEIPYELFKDCTHLTELYLGAGAKQIGSKAFAGCTNLKKISINEDLSYIPTTALEGVDKLEEIEINGTTRINYESFKGKDSIRKITIDGNEYSLEENEKLISIQKHNEKVAIVFVKDGRVNTRCINLEKKKEVILKNNIYLANDDSIVRCFNSAADIKVEALQYLKKIGEQKIYISGAIRDIKPHEHKKGIEFDLYDIDDMIQIKKIIEEIKKDIVIPAKEDKHRQKKIYSQIVRKLSERMEYDFFDEYMSESNEQIRNSEKEKYEKMTGKNWDDYLKQNENNYTLKTYVEDSNLMGLKKGKAVCRGNVEIIRNLAAEFGIEVTSIIGAKHIWNQVKLDGMWYDDDFTNYESYLARGDLDKASKRFLCGQVNGESIFSKQKMYSKTFNKANDVGKEYSFEDKKFLLNYGYKKKNNVQSIQESQQTAEIKNTEKAKNVFIEERDKQRKLDSSERNQQIEAMQKNNKIQQMTSESNQNIGGKSK